MIPIYRSTFLVTVCGCLLFSANKLQASTSITLEALHTSGVTKNSPTNEPLEDSYTKSAQSDGASGQWSEASGTVWARSQTGWLRLKSDGTASAQSPIGSWTGVGNAVAQAYWQDSLTVNGGAAVQGQPGEMTATMVIDGSLALGGGDPNAGTPLANGAGSYFFIQATMNGVNGKYGENQNFLGGIQLRYVSGGGTATTAFNGNLIGPGTWQVKFPFVFGQAASLYIFSRTIADAHAVVYSAADGRRNNQSTCDFRGGVRWAGITGVRVTNGAAVTGYTISATSNFDYAAGAAASPFAITQFAVTPGVGLTMTWTDSALRSYTVEKSLSLTPGSWAPVAGVTWPITANTITLSAQTDPKAFFRLRAE